MPIIKNNEPLPERPVILVIFGDPGVSKTSIFNTCNDPLLLDFDRGVDRSFLRKTTLVPKNWREVLDLERQGALDEYKTIGIDTAKACLDDFLMVHVIERDQKLAYNKLRAFGEVGDEFKLFTNRRRSKDADIVIIAHAKKDDDTKKFLPDITGQSYSLIMRIADQVGYVTIENGKRTISFEPTDMKVGKNVACLPTLDIPDRDSKEFSSFGAKLIADIRSSIAKMSEEQVAALNLSNEYQDRINKVEDLKTLKDILPELDTLPDYLKLPLYEVFSNRYKNAIETAETTDALTELTFIIAELPKVLSGAIKKTLLAQGEKMGWEYIKEDGCWSAKAPDAQKPESSMPKPETKLFAKKHKTAEAVATDISIAATAADLATIYKYNRELIDADSALSTEFTVREQELKENNKETANV